MSHYPKEYADREHLEAVKNKVFLQKKILEVLDDQKWLLSELIYEKIKDDMQN
jgi:hypothetical protein